MTNVETAPRVSPDNDAQKSGERGQDEYDAIFNDIAFGNIVEGWNPEDTQEAEDKTESEHRIDRGVVTTVADLAEAITREAAEHAQIEKTKELAKWLDGPDERRRGLAAIYGKDTVESMTDADVEAFIAEKTGEASTITKPEIQTSTETEEIPVPSAPEGFPTRAEAEAELEEQGPVRLSLMQRARLAAGAPGRMIWKGYSKLFDKAAQRSDRYNDLTPEAQDKLKKRVGILTTLAATAIGVIAYSTKADGLVHQFSIGGGSSAPKPDDAVPNNRVRGIEEYPAFEHDRRVQEFIYNPNDPRDPMNNPARHEYNFGAGLNLESADAARADLLEGLKHNPTQLAAAMGSFGLIPNNQGSIESIADLMRNDPTVMMANYDLVHDAAANVPVSLTAEQTATYGSYSAISNNGNTVLTYQNVTDTQPFLVFQTAGGEVCFGGGCRQPVYLSSPGGGAPVVSQAVGNGSNPQMNTLVGNRPWQGNGGGNPQQPNNPNNGGGNPQQPNNPQPGGEQPGGEQPGGEEPGGEEPGSETPDDKVWTGGVDTGDGINPAENERIGPTGDPLTTGNGTGSPNLTTGPQAGGESTTLLEGALPNTDPQVGGVQPGLDTGWKPDTPGQADQGAADTTGNVIDTQMGQPGAVDSAVDDAVAGMGTNGRPLGSGGGSGAGTGLGNLGSLGSSPGAGLGSGLGNGTGGLGALSGNGTGINAGLGSNN